MRIFQNLLYLSLFLCLLAISSCGEECDGVECGNGTAVEISSGTCECDCDEGSFLSNGICVLDACQEFPCGDNGMVVQSEPLIEDCECLCDPGYTIDPFSGLCIQDSCLLTECENGTQEILMDGSCSCTCDPGFVQNLVGLCIVNPCIDVECEPNGQALIDENDACLCSCNPGFINDENGLCIPDPCLNVDCGSDGQALVDEFDACFCQCNPGFILDPTEFCVPDPCLPINCGDNGTQVFIDTQTCECDCDPDYIFDGSTCIINCDDSTCINGDCGSEGCDCDNGYEGAECDVLSVTKFLGNWTATVTYTTEIGENSTCFEVMNVYNFEIRMNGTSVSNVVLEGYGGNTTNGELYFETLVANVNGNDVTLLTQASTPEIQTDAIFSGEGEFSLENGFNAKVDFQGIWSEIDDNTLICTFSETATWIKN